MTAGASRPTLAGGGRPCATMLASLVLGLALIASAIAPGDVRAQAREQVREHRSYGSGDPEAKLMLYYSSALAFSPLGAPLALGGDAAMGRVASTRSRVEAAVELSYVPPLSEAQRTATGDKPQATNLAPLFARPRLAVRLPGNVALEASWIPPVRVFDVKANVVSGALARPFASGRLAFVPRVSFLAGQVEGPITCNAETAREEGADLQVYYAFVCHGNDSEDRFEPLHVGGELLVAPASWARRWRPYVGVGARYESTEFDIGVIRGDGTRDPDHPVLEVSTTRAFGTAGVSWEGLARTRFAAELYYAPGSVFTVRALGGIRVW